MSDPIHLETRREEKRRLFSPTAGRNSGPISDILADILSPKSSVLEVGSGTGEHALAMCSKRSDITWQLSDPDARSRQSQDDWRLDLPDQMKPSLDLDMTKIDWWGGLPGYDAIYSANMIHIAPWEAALGLAKGAGHLLGKNGLVLLYGPFKEGSKTAQSNLNFDQSLKSRNPEWGVRTLDSVKHIFADVGFNQQARYEMPAENKILVFSRQ